MVGRTVVTSRSLSYILSQVEGAKSELTAYQPSQIDWYRRCQSSVKRLIPWLEREACSLAGYVTEVMNSPKNVRDSADAIKQVLKSQSTLSKDEGIQDLIARLDRNLDYEKMLLSGTGGTVLSKLIEKYLIESSTDWTLESNGASDYPDLFFRSDDYSGLPRFRRGKKQVYGAAIKGTTERPVRIPDGLEIKTCRKKYAVDCHHAHAGLHLVLVFDFIDDRFEVIDILVGFLRYELYRITKPASPTTTLKASFNGQHFF